MGLNYTKTKCSHRKCTELWYGWGWQASLEVIWSSPPAQAWPPRVSCPGPPPDPTSSVGNLFQWLTILTGEELFPIVDRNSCLCTLPLFPWLRNIENTLPPTPLHPSFRYLNTVVGFSRAFMLSSVSSFSLSSYMRCSNPLIILMALCWSPFSVAISVFYWRAQNWTQTPDVDSPSAE